LFRAWQSSLPGGTACASVLIAGEKGGDFAKPAYIGLATATIYAVLQHLLHIIAESPTWISQQTNKYFPSAQIAADVTPEYMGVGYIIGPKISGVLVAGGVLAWMCLIPLLATLVSPDVIAMQQIKLGFLQTSPKQADVVHGIPLLIHGEYCRSNLSRLCSADWRGCCCGRRIYYIAQINSNYYLFIQRWSGFYERARNSDAFENRE
jgi:hypothetical protein